MIDFCSRHLSYPTQIAGEGSEGVLGIVRFMRQCQKPLVQGKMLLKLSFTLQALALPNLDDGADCATGMPPVAILANTMTRLKTPKGSRIGLSIAVTSSASCQQAMAAC